MKSKITINIPKEVHKGYFIYCAKKGISMTDDIRKFIERRIKK